MLRRIKMNLRYCCGLGQGVRCIIGRGCIGECRLSGRMHQEYHFRGWVWWVRYHRNGVIMFWRVYPQRILLLSLYQRSRYVVVSQQITNSSDHYRNYSTASSLTVETTWRRSVVVYPTCVWCYLSWMWRRVMDCRARLKWLIFDGLDDTKNTLLWVVVDRWLGPGWLFLHWFYIYQLSAIINITLDNPSNIKNIY